MEVCKKVGTPCIMWAVLLAMASPLAASAGEADGSRQPLSLDWTSVVSFGLPANAQQIGEWTVSAASGYRPSRKVSRLFQKAMREFDRGKHKDAEKLLREAAVADPHFVAARNNLGALLMRQKRLLEAEPVLREAFAADPKSAPVLQNLGVTLTLLQQFASAIPHLREALRLHPDSEVAHLHLGIALVETGAYVEAERELKRAVPKLGEYEALGHLALGKLYAQMGDRARAAASFEAYLRLAPPNSPNIDPARKMLKDLRPEKAPQDP